MLMSEINQFLMSPLTAGSGQPLRVAVYSRLSAAIRRGLLLPGAMLPKESDLGEQMGVSRTVIREALMLLEEDGLLLTRRGIGRFVTHKLPTPGLENLLPPEEIFGYPPGEIRLQRIDARLQQPSDFTHKLLETSDDDASWFCESLIYSGNTVIALLQEHLPAGQRLDAADPRIAPAVDFSARQYHCRSVHSLLLNILQETPQPAVCQLQAGVPGEDRGKKLDIAADAPVMVLTRSLRYPSGPLYLAKMVIKAGFPLSINQSVSAL